MQRANFYVKMHQKLLGGWAPSGPAGETYRPTVPSDLAARTLWGRGLVMCRYRKRREKDWDGGKRREGKVKGVVPIGLAKEGPWGPSPPKGGGKNLHNRFSCAKGTNSQI